MSEAAEIARLTRGQPRRVRLGKVTYVDKLGGYFPNFTYKFQKLPEEKQVLNVEDFAVDGEVVDRDVDPWDKEATAMVRKITKDISRFINTANFYTSPIYSDVDKLAVILPTERGGNTSGLDALTFNTPEFDAFMSEVARRCSKVATTDQEFESIKNLFINYSIAYPRTVAICHDGRVKADRSKYPHEKMGLIGSVIWQYLSEAFWKTDMDDKVSLNITKSPGFPKIWPDGRPLIASEQCYMNLSHAEQIRDKTLMRRNYKPFKLAWLESGSIDRNLEYLLGNLDYCLTPEGLCEMYKRYFCNAASYGLRMNNGDTPLVDSWENILKNPKAAGKNRPAVYEIAGDKMRSLTLDTSSWAAAFHKKNGTTKAPLKPRYMYPAPNATYAAPFNGLFKRLIGIYEESPSGFPSMNIKVLARYERNFKRFPDKHVVFLQFDRSNSEQFITDNFDLLLSLFPSAFQKLLLFIGTSLLPSDFGPRVVRGGLPSGSPATTFLNMMMGLAENVFQILSVCKVPITSPYWDRYAKAILKQVFESEDAIEINGHYILANWGTDDQIACIWPAGPLGEPDVDGRSLGAEIVEEATVFGLSFSAAGVAVAKSLNLDKFHVQEHLKAGDAMAYKMAMRLRAMDPKFRDAITSTLYDFHYGDASDYDNGEVAYQTVLADYGYVPDPIANIYKPSDSIVFKDVLQLEMGASNNIPTEYTRKWDELFDSYFRANKL